jgi:hypothetical protein
MKSCIHALAQVLGGNWSKSATEEEVQAFMAGGHPGPGLNDFRLAFQRPASDSWNHTATQVFSTIWHQYLLGQHQFSDLSADLNDKLTMILSNAHYLQTIPLHTVQKGFISRYSEFKKKYRMANADNHPGMADRQAAKRVRDRRNVRIRTVCNVHVRVPSAYSCFNSYTISVARHAKPRGPLMSMRSA